VTCEGFNDSFAAFYTSTAGGYEAVAERNRHAESALFSEIEDQRALKRRLQRQAFRARQLEIRRQLGMRVRELNASIRADRARLKRMKSEHRGEEEQFKDRFRIELRSWLQSRPPGCAVSIPGAHKDPTRSGNR